MKTLPLINSSDDKVYLEDQNYTVISNYYQFDKDSIIKTKKTVYPSEIEDRSVVNEISYIKKFEQVHSSFRIQTSYSLF